MTNLYEAARQNVQKEAADKLDGINGHDLLLVSVSRIAPAECDTAIGEGKDAAVRNGNTVRVAGKILDRVGRAGEGRFGVNHPFECLQVQREVIEGNSNRKWLEQSG